MLDLYHRTTPEKAWSIRLNHRFWSDYSGGEVFFSTMQRGQAEGFGQAIVHVRVPEDLAHLDDEFPDGEQHYWVKAADIKAEHFVEFSLGTRVRLVRTNDKYTDLVPGAEGVVDFIDDTGTTFVAWDNGSRLGMLPDFDQIERIDS